MNRSIPALLAILLVLSLTAVPLAAESGGGPSPATQTRLQSTETTDSGLQAIPNTTNRLALDDASRTEYADPELGFGTLLAKTDDELAADHIQYSIAGHEFDDATDEQQQRMLEDTYDRLKRQSDDLESRERQAVRAHANGELSSTQLLQTFSRNYREAAVLSDALDDLEERSDRVSGFSLSVDDEQDKLEMYRTELRSELESATSGRDLDDSVSIAIRTSQNGFTVSMLDESYVREATRFDNRDTTRETQFDDLIDAYDYTRNLYPWAYETGTSPSFSELTTAQLYLIDIGHDQGRLKAYLDGGTGDIYREVQVVNENALPVTSTHTDRTDNLTLSINKTGAGGPSEVTVTNTPTGEPASASISVDGFEVGETDDEGTLWYVPPAESYELTAETETTGINATVSNE